VDCAAGTPTGPVQFMEGANLLATVALSGRTAAFTVPSLASGSHTYTALFGGSGNFLASGSAAVTVAPAATATALTATAGTFGSTQLTALVSAGGAIPVGTVTFTEAGAALGSAALDNAGRAVLAAGGLHAGSHLLVAQFDGNPAFLASASSPGELTVAPAATSTTLVADHPGSLSGAQATFTATVTSAVPSALGAPAGTVVFLDAAVPLGSAALAGSTAVFPTTALHPGTRSVTASFQGSQDFLPSTSAALAQAVTLTLQLAPQTVSLSLRPGQTGSFHLTLGAVGALADPVALGVVDQPAGVTVTIDPPALDAAASLPAGITVTVTAPSTGASVLAGAAGIPAGGGWGWMAVVSGLVAVPVAGRRGRRRVGLLLLVCVIGLAGLAACGGGGGSASAVAQSRHTPFQITATAPGATAGSASVDLELAP